MRAQSIILLLMLSALTLSACNRTTTPPTVEETPTPVVEEIDTNTDETIMPSPKVVLTLAEIAKHATADNCWFAIEGKVYDVTAYIAGAKHPGGEAILAGCGKDATAMFNNRASDGQPHSANARLGLEKYYLGQLVVVPDSTTTTTSPEATSSPEAEMP